MAATHHVKRHAHAGEGLNIVLSRFIYFLFAVITVIILLRIIFLLSGSEQNNFFVETIYTLSTVFIAPFFLIFAYNPTYGAPVFELSSVVALFVYILVGWGLGFLITMGSWHSDEV